MLWRKRLSFPRKGSHYALPLLLFLFFLCVLVYYFGELVDFAGCGFLRRSFFYQVHDIQRLFFIAPVLYSAYLFAMPGALAGAAASLIAFLPRALFVSPYPQPLARALVFVLFLGLLGIFVAWSFARLAAARERPTLASAPSRPPAPPPTSDMPQRREDEVFVAGDVEVDIFRHEVRRRGEPIKLTPTEFKILAYMVYNRGRVVTHLELLRRVWGPEYGQETEYLRVYVGQLRRKLEANPANPQLILTQQGIGYRLVDPEEALRRAQQPYNRPLG